MLLGEERRLLEDDLRLAEMTVNRKYVIGAEELIRPDHCRDLLDELRLYLQAPDLAVTASQFSKRYAFLSVLPILAAMTLFDKGLDGRVENCGFQWVNREGNWFPRLVLEQETVTTPLPGRRGVWRNQVLERVFAGHLFPVWSTLAEVSGLKRSLLWENTAVYLYWLYEKKLPQLPGADPARIREDFGHLMQYFSRDPLGVRVQPMRRFFRASGEAVRIRRTCCLHYRMGSDCRPCSNCPLTNKGVHRREVLAGVPQ